MPDPNGESPAAQAPEHGSMVVYRHEMRDDHHRYRMAVAVGPVLTDPAVGGLWVGVRLPRHDGDHPVDLIHVASIIDVQPPHADEPRTAA